MAAVFRTPARILWPKSGKMQRWGHPAERRRKSTWCTPLAIPSKLQPNARSGWSWKRTPASGWR